MLLHIMPYDPSNLSVLTHYTISVQSPSKSIPPKPVSFIKPLQQLSSQLHSPQNGNSKKQKPHLPPKYKP